MTSAPENSVGWRIQTSASAYSYFAGVLAAFVFGAIVLLLGNPPAVDSTEGPSAPTVSATEPRVLGLLLVTFASLTVTSFLFAVLSGEIDDTRGFLLGVGASLLLAMSVQQVMLSIAWCLDLYTRYGADKVVPVATWLLAVVSLIVVPFLLTLCGDFVWMVTGEDWKKEHKEMWCGIAPPAILIPLGFALHGWANVSDTFQPIALTSSMVLAVVVAVTYGLLSDVSPFTVKNKLTHPLALSLVVMSVAALYTFVYAESLPT